MEAVEQLELANVVALAGEGERLDELLEVEEAVLVGVHEAEEALGEELAHLGAGGPRADGREDGAEGGEIDLETRGKRI